MDRRLAIYIAGISMGLVLRTLIDSVTEWSVRRRLARAQEAARVELDRNADQAQRDIRMFFEAACARAAANGPSPDCQCANCTRRRQEAEAAKRSN